MRWFFTRSAALPVKLVLLAWLLYATVVAALGALVKVGAFDSTQSFGTPRLNQGVEFGTRLPATGTLLWFSPDANQLPTPVTMTTPERGELIAEGRRLTLDRRGDEWVVGAPQRADASR